MKFHLRNILFLLTLFMAQFSSLAQNSISQDSIKVLKEMIRKGDPANDLYYTLYDLQEVSPDLALELSQLWFQTSKERKDTTSILESIGRMASIYMTSGQYEKNLEYSIMQNKIAEAKRDTVEIISALSNLSNAFSLIGNKSNALKYSTEALALAEMTRNKYMMGILLLNIGDDYRKLNDFSVARVYTERALEVFKEIDRLQDIGFCWLNLGEIELDQGNFREALPFTSKAYDIFRNGDDQINLAYAMEDLGAIYREQGKFDESLRMLKKSEEIALRLNAKPQLSSVYEDISLTYEKIQKWDKAFEYFKLYKKFDDEIEKHAHSLQTSVMEFEYETDKKLKEIEILNKDKELAASALQNQATEKYWLVTGLALLLVLVVVIYIGSELRNRDYKKLKEQNIEIRLQKEEIQSQKENIERQNKLLADKNKELDEINEEKDYLVGIVAHDLKSPLKQILGLITLINIEGDALSENQRECLDRIQDSANRLNEMINKILDMDALKSKDVKLDLKRIDLGLHLKDVVKGFRNIADKKNIQLVEDFEKDQIFVLVDTNYSAQIFENLITNSIKFSPFDTTISVKMKKDQRKVTVAITDQGPGIKPEEKKKLFKKFQKLSAVPTAGEKSTGLGLSIVKKYVEVLKGDVWCESDGENGATFYVSLPTIS